MGNLSAQLSKGFEGKLDSAKEEAKSAQKATDALKAAGVTVKESTFSSTAANKELVINAIGEANIKLWDTSDESGERIRVQFYNRLDKGVLTRAAQNAEIVGASVSAENETRSPVFAISADDSVRLKTALKNTFKAEIKDEALLAKVEVPRFEKVGATAGQQLRNKGILAVVYALIFILLYIALRFDPRYSPGAIVALIHDVSITLGLFCLTGREFNLPIIAALLAIVGYSLNDTIVVYDRIRENQDEAAPGSTVRGIINASINDCLSRTILTSVTTFLAVLAIQVFGGGIIENFAFAMLVGVIAGTYSSIYIASPLVLAMDNYFERRAEREAAIDEVLAQ
ncbi:MAG: protein translocase subunit SecF [Myxococcales bacterium]|nr:protein translocase subunit SecF [Myxococcales bacterium]